MALPSRRRFLAAATTTGIAGLAGCMMNGTSLFDWTQTAEETTDPLPGESDGWPQYGRNPRHTGFADGVRLDDPSEDWRFELAGSVAPPAVVGDRVVVHGGAESESDDDGGDTGGAVFSLRAADGTEQWRRNLPYTGYGYSGCPPIVYRGSVYVGHAGESGVYAIDAREGSPRWRHETDDSVNEAAVGFRKQVFASTGDKLLAHGERGHTNWIYRTGSDRSSVSPPAVGGGYVIYTTAVLGSVVALDPSANGGHREWLYRDDREFGTPTVANETVYVPGYDRIHAIDVTTGDGVWTKEATVSSSIATDGDRLFATTASGELVAYAATDGSEQWRTTLAADEGVYLRTRPLVTERSVVVTTEKPQIDERVTTYAVDRRTGETRWSVAQPGNVGFDAVAADGRMYVPSYWSSRDGGGTLVALSD